MKRAITFSIAALALAGTALPTLAADLGAPPVGGLPVGAPYNWSGIYVGVNAGGKWGDYTGTQTIGRSTDAGATVAAPGVSVLFGSNSFANTAFLAGGQIGLNYQVDQWVLGIEADFDATDVRRTFTVPASVCMPTLMACDPVT